MAKSGRKRNRRTAARRSPLDSAKVVCVAGEGDDRRNIAVALLNVSLFGAQLVVAAQIPPGTQVVVGFEVVGETSRPVVNATVVWCGPFPDGGYTVGTQFQKPLSHAVLQALCAFKSPEGDPTLP